MHETIFVDGGGLQQGCNNVTGLYCCRPDKHTQIILHQISVMLYVCPYKLVGGLTQSGLSSRYLYNIVIYVFYNLNFYKEK